VSTCIFPPKLSLQRTERHPDRNVMGPVVSVAAKMVVRIDLLDAKVVRASIVDVMMVERDLDLVVVDLAGVALLSRIEEPRSTGYVLARKGE